MAITLRTHKMLWGRGGNRCAWEDCRRELVWDESGSADPAIVGDEAHIVARQRRGPRGRDDVPLKERDGYPNLILLCKVHHKLIDDQPERYSKEWLLALKERHEEWVRSTLGIDVEHLLRDEQLASIVEEWARRITLDDWERWISGLSSHGQPRISRSALDALDATSAWLFNRVWPKGGGEVQRALENFRRVARDLYNVFLQHAIEFGGDAWITEKYYHIPEWDEARYSALLRDYERHVDLVEDLAFEATRATNLVCDTVRRNLWSDYRLKEGALTIRSGPNIDLRWTTYRPEYTADEYEAGLYEGLETFAESSRRIFPPG